MNDNKVVIVTGASGGMGKEVIQKLLENNAFVTGIDINLDSLSDLNHNHLTKAKVNLTDETSIKNVFSETFENHGKIDALVNIAGIAQSSTSIEEVSLDEWNKIMNINATGVFLTCKEAVKYMKKNNNGAILNIGSVSVARPRPGLQSYIASKGAIEAFSSALAIEVAPYFIRVNVLHPGPSQTSMLSKFSSVKQQEIGLNMDDFKKSVPLGELIHPKDISNSVNFLISDEANMITGESIHVAGGRNL